MAATALQPACAPANALLARFDAAMRHHGRQTARQASLPASPTIAEDLVAAEAVERSLGRLIATPAPDVLALGRKLHVILCAAGAPPELRASIAADVRQLAGREASDAGRGRRGARFDRDEGALDRQPGGRGMKDAGWLHPQAYVPANVADMVPGSLIERLVKLAQALVPEDLQRLCDDAIGLWEYRAKTARRAGMTSHERCVDELKERIEKWHKALADPTKRDDRLAMSIWRRMLHQDEAELRCLGTKPRKDTGRAT